MGRNAVGFYWTLPVPWAGFTRLPTQIDEAAKASRTIRYQREAIRHHAKEEGYRIIHEEVFLEIEPDRGSELILAPLKKVEKICRKHDAVLLLVDLPEVQLWRRHMVLLRWSEEAPIKVQRVFPGEILIDGRYFDPHAHFRAWRKKQERWIAGKAERKAKALERAQELREQKLSNKKIADTLNAEKLPSLTGKDWTADNVQKLLKK